MKTIISNVINLIMSFMLTSIHYWLHDYVPNVFEFTVTTIALAILVDQMSSRKLDE